MGLLTPGSRRTYGSVTFALHAMSFIPGLPIPRGYSLNSLVGRSKLTMITSIAVPPGSFSSSHRDSQPRLDRKAFDHSSDCRRKCKRFKTRADQPHSGNRGDELTSGPQRTSSPIRVHLRFGTQWVVSADEPAGDPAGH
jgi:hypothetical protein